MLQLNLGNKTLIFDRPAVMGILNVTPDSFSDGGHFNQMDKALQHCEEMIANGADFIDIGGCSTRPNNAIATEQEEMERVVPILKAIRKAFPETLISIDTFRKNVAEACMAEGADIINKPSFGYTGWGDYNFEEVELIGLCTDICVISNALIIKALFPEIKVSVDSSCCAGVTPAKHEAALETMRSCQVEVQ